MMPDPAIDQEPQAPKEMSVWEHLEELRWVVVRAIIGVVVGIVICTVFGEWIIEEVIIAPTKRTTPPMQLFNPEVFGQLSLYMQVAIWGGVILSFPHTLIQIWKFIEPGLKEKERKYVGAISFFTIVFFLLGMAVSYFVMLPLVLDFAAEFGMSGIVNFTDVNKYLSIFLQILLAAGIIFELPLVSYFLSKLGILTPQYLRHYRKHAIVALLLISAVLSPGGNPMLQLIVFVPLWGLFELSIISSAIVQRQKRKEALADGSAV